MPTLPNLQSLINAQTAVMDDLCNIYSVSYASGTYSTQGSKTRVLRHSGTYCGLEFMGLQEYERGQDMMGGPDCILRLRSTVDVRMTDEIELVEKGDFLISGTFVPYKYPTVNSTVQHVQLKRVAP